MRPERAGELVGHRRERAELRVAECEQLGERELARFVECVLDDPCRVLDECDGVGEEAIDVVALDHVVVRGEEARRPQGLQRPGRAEVVGDVEVGRRVDHVAVHVEEAAGHHRVDHDRRARRGLPEPDVAGRMTREVEDLDREVRPESDVLAAAQGDVDRQVRPDRVAQPREDVGLVAETVRLVPPVALAHDRLGALDPGNVERVREEERLRRGLADRRVAAVVVDVGVRVEDEVRLEPVEERQDHLGRASP